MNIYIAARFSQKELVNQAYTALTKKGHEITIEWTKHADVKPYHMNAPEVSRQAAVDIKGVLASDVFIIFSDAGGKGMYVELGTALAKGVTGGQIKIFVVGSYNTNCLFYFHPSVKRKETIEDVLDEI